MTRKRNRRARIHCAVGVPKPARPGLPRRPAHGGTAVVVVVVVLTVALSAVLVATGMSAGVSLELAAGGWLLAARLRQERV
ncbi:hypothetical protein [Kitasatospora sp. NPDC086791]|uniref:hypothetical protein n=1 Tax=Kitasatospora sp. NPDC086791 TaxID=3155178 RepID=UPI0034365EA0